MKLGFVIMWLATFLAIGAPFSEQIRLTDNRCSIGAVKPMVAAGFIAVTVFDTLVFCAISFRILRIGWRAREKTWVGFTINSQGLSSVTKELLLSGQLYYLYVIVSVLGCEVLI